MTYTVTIDQISYDVRIDGDDNSVTVNTVGGSIMLDLANLRQSGATSGQVPTWNGAAWAPATPSGGGGGGVTDGDKGDIIVTSGGTVWSIDYTAVNATIQPTWNNVSGKPSTFTPAAHTQTASTITDFDAAADARVSAGITGKQDLDATLTALAALNATAGAVEQTGDDTFTKRAFGTGASTSILTRADGDARFATAAQGVLADSASQPGHTHSLTTDVTGTLQAAQAPAYTGGDVTSTAGSLALNIAANAVVNADLAQVATATFKGRTTAGTGNPEDMTTTQATALLDIVTSSAKGLAPASGGGTTNFLRADGTWAAPSASVAYPQVQAGSGTQVRLQNLHGSPGLAAATAGIVRLYPYVAAYTQTFAQFGVNVTTPVASSLAKVAVYATDATGVPTTLLGETGDLDCSSTGFKSAALSLTLYKGTVYWLGVRVNSTQSLSTMSNALPIAGRSAFSNGTDSSIQRTITYSSGSTTPWTYLASDIQGFQAAWLVTGVTA